MRTSSFTDGLVELDPPREGESSKAYLQRIVGNNPVELHEGATVEDLADDAFWEVWEVRLAFLKGEDDDE